MEATDFTLFTANLRSFVSVKKELAVLKPILMKIIQFLNLLLSLGFISVLYGTISMVAFKGYDDDLSLTCFVLHSINGFLLIARAIYKT